MGKKYPMTANYLSYKKIDHEHYEIMNWLTEEKYIADIKTMILLKNLDGKTDPYSIQCNMSRNEIKQNIAQLYEAEFVRDSMTLIKEFGCYYRTVFITKWTNAKRKSAYISNLLLLLLLFIPVFLVGLDIALNMRFIFSVRILLFGQLFGLLCGGVFHEWAHAVASLSYGGRVFEFGVMIDKFLPGAYTLMDISQIKKKRYRVQVCAAGIESNIFLAGVFFILSAIVPKHGNVFFYAGIQNGIIAIINLAFFDGLDGMNIVSALVGTENLKKRIKAVIRYPSLKKMISGKGIGGKIAVALCYAVYLQPVIIIPAVILFEMMLV